MAIKSILQDNEMFCYICGRYLREGDWHHVYNAAYKKKSERYGLMVRLCRECHEKLHTSGMQKFKARIQRQAMIHYDWTEEDFREIFGTNYL